MDKKIDDAKYVEKPLRMYNSKTGEYDYISPRTSTNTIYNAKGETLDDLLQFTPADLKERVEEILGEIEANKSKLNELTYTKAMTQSQYDALGTAEKNRTDVWYGIYKE